jgi:hypothetical protein
VEATFYPSLSASTPRQSTLLILRPATTDASRAVSVFLQQLGWGHSKGPGELDDVHKANVGLTALHRSDESPVAADTLGQFFLRNAGDGPNQSELPAEQDLRIHESIIED